MLIERKSCEHYKKGGSCSYTPMIYKAYSNIKLKCEYKGISCDECNKMSCYWHKKKRNKPKSVGCRCNTCLWYCFRWSSLYKNTLWFKLIVTLAICSVIFALIMIKATE